MANMKEIRISNTVLTKIPSTLILILLTLSGMAAITSANGVTPIMFYGNVSHNGEWAQPGTVINAYVGDELCSEPYTVTEERSGMYYIYVLSESDEDELITFTIAEDPAVQTATWHASTGAETRQLDIYAGDLPVGDPPSYEPPSTGATSNGGSTSGGYVSPATTPTETDAQPVSGELVTSAPSVTPAETSTPSETSTKKLAEKPETKGLLPGFEAVFAIAGLLAVAYLNRRR